MLKHKEPKFGNFDSFEEFFEQAEKRSDYWLELAKLEFTREIVDKMNKDGISRKELAARLEVQPGMITRLLGGRNNFELSTMVRMAMALNCRFRSHIEPLGAETMWIDVSSVDNYHISTALLNSGSVYMSSPIMASSHFSSLTNHVSGDAALSENSKDWRKNHKNLECDLAA